MSKESKEYWGDMTYDEIWDSWSARYSFGAKGELTLDEAKQIHAKWKLLGIQAKAGLI